MTSVQTLRVQILATIRERTPAYLKQVNCMLSSSQHKLSLKTNPIKSGMRDVCRYFLQCKPCLISTCPVLLDSFLLALGCCSLTVEETEILQRSPNPQAIRAPLSKSI